MNRILILSAVVSGAFVESITWAANVPFGGMCEPDESNNWCGQTGSAGFGTFEILIAVIVILYVYRLIKKVALESKEKRQERIQLIRRGLFGIAIGAALIFAVLLLLEYDDKTRTKESKTQAELILQNPGFGEKVISTEGKTAAELILQNPPYPSLQPIHQ